jgi:hypothetical protein
VARAFMVITTRVVREFLSLVVSLMLSVLERVESHPLSTQMATSERFALVETTAFLTASSLVLDKSPISVVFTRVSVLSLAHISGHQILTTKWVLKGK